jgi:5-(carboxyamino)imidazole ribonucleotide mutase
MGIGKAGANNAAILAAQILARNDSKLAQKLHAYKKKLADKVEQRDSELRNTRDV